VRAGSSATRSFERIERIVPLGLVQSNAIIDPGRIVLVIRIAIATLALSGRDRSIRRNEPIAIQGAGNRRTEIDMLEAHFEATAPLGGR
jgi:hypothetical protein